MRRGVELRQLMICPDAEPLTLTVVGHQVVQKSGAKGLLVRTEELGAVVFALPDQVLSDLISDLARLRDAAWIYPLRRRSNNSGVG